MDQTQPPGFSEVIQLLSALPGLQLVFIALAAVTWLAGGNILCAFHYKRVGKSAWSVFKPFAFPFIHFNAKEWLILAGLAALSFTFMGIAISLNP
jgi:hypothetical protein